MSESHRRSSDRKKHNSGESGTPKRDHKPVEIALTKFDPVPLPGFVTVGAIRKALKPEPGPSRHSRYNPHHTLRIDTDGRLRAEGWKGRSDR